MQNYCPSHVWMLHFFSCKLNFVSFKLDKVEILSFVWTYQFSTWADPVNHNATIARYPCLNCPGGGGYFHQNRTWMCLPDVKNLTFSIPIFCLISHPSVYHFCKKRTQFGPNWVLLQWFAKNTPNLCNLGFFVSDENPRSLYKISRKSTPKGRHIYMYVYHVNVRPPGELHWWNRTTGKQGKC